MQLPTPPVLLPLGVALRLLPDAVHTRLFSTLVNHLLKGQPAAEELGPLEGKRICLSVTDHPGGICFLVKEGGVSPWDCKADDDWDVRIRGRLEDFWRLAARAEDPDTLFFSRRLDLEGETEAGLYLKNLLDTAEPDWESHIHAVLGERAGAKAVCMLNQLGLGKLLPGGLHPSQ
ncbi:MULTISPECIES: ubiquinone anaerobic biosynthesis accessory factor UbiT [Ectothiorhodospira]|uniref:Ubiquinone biosynthesis accessory factor UbiT n=1 Tax=Ectothiorhodospira marina TaxID=1396821 RepID=A0A1H7H4P4_9GAMM|nr:MULTISPECIES: SCP2 sterol-binding domain-containing protein [Ectothiorhodospira]MCG5515629.1 SCP2 sterol-binding domain-containing protein [Ectothiorhodospira sp. 9100]MCG5518847.1 SCP2 sterol-binding domain-containing protein [Ectothiorhodospira sp. 9905]SEK43085.1 Predicted lipid carrier protein YhbT, contains SCP2 domain [Ectothiorhodospira marina]